MVAPQMMPATPLSAALGPAAQATMPLPYQQQGPSQGGYSASSSRSGTLLNSHAPTITSTIAETGVNFPGNGLNSPALRMKPT